MAATVTAENFSDKPIGSYDDLLSIFHAAIKPASEFRVGAEMEKFGVYEDGSPIPYDGDRGVRALAGRAAGQRGGWVRRRVRRGRRRRRALGGVACGAAVAGRPSSRIAPSDHGRSLMSDDDRLAVHYFESNDMLGTK